MDGVLNQYGAIFGSSGFIESFIFSAIIGGVINVIAFIIALLVILQISRLRSMILLFSIGLFLMFSLSPVLKILVLKTLFDNSYLISTGLYIFHLMPLYILLYLFSFSFINTEIFSYAKIMNVSYTRLIVHFLKRKKLTLLIFWNFIIVFIAFNTSKDLINSSLFSFQDLHNAFPFYAFELNRLTFDIIKIVPVVILLIPSIILAFFLRKDFKLNTEISSASIFLPSFSSLKTFKKKLPTVRINNNYWMGYIIGIIPIGCYLLFTMTFMNVNALNWRFLLNTFISCSLIALFTVYAFVFLNYIFVNKKGVRTSIMYVLFILALLPGEIIGSFVNILNITSEFNIPIAPLFEIPTFFGFLLFYGVFPFFFINLSLTENHDAFRLGNNYNLKRKDKINLFLKLNSKGIILSLVFFAVLICNDSIITSTVNLTDMESKSIAFKISEIIRSTKELDAKIPVILILTNFFLVILSPFYNKIVELLGILPFSFPKIKFFK